MPHGVLFCASGTSDYLLISLLNSNLHLRVNLGSGNLQLSSRRLQLADLRWHSVFVRHTRRKLLLVVDGTQVFERNITGSKRELNVNTVSLGGVPQLIPARYTGPYFRGCLRHPRFAAHLLFPYVTKMHNLASLYKVRWGCANEEFEAPVTAAITLLANSSFAAFPSFLRGGRLTFELRTRSTHGLVLFNSARVQRTGLWRRSHYVALELLNGALHLVLRRFFDNMTMEIYQRDQSVSDGEWHRVELSIRPNFVALVIDNLPERRILTEMGRVSFDFSKPLYLGGIDAQAIDEANRLGYMGSTTSIAGCLREVRANGLARGFPQMRASENLRVNCLWTFPCTASPCVEGAHCLERGLADYECRCPVDKPDCR